MVVETAPVVPREEDDGAGPIGSLLHGIDQASRPGLTIAQQGRWMFTIRLTGGDPTDGREGAALSIFIEIGHIGDIA